MKLAIETCFLHDQYYRRGIGRYGREMVARILQSALHSELPLEIHILSFTNLTRTLELLELPAADFQQLINSTPRPGFTLHFHSLGEVKLSQPQVNIPLYLRKIRPLVRKIQPDKYFAPHFERGLPSDLVPTYAVAHDAIPLINQSYSRQGKIVNYLKGKFFQYMWDKLRDCEVVFTSSNVSKADLIEFGKIPASKIEVIYLGVSDVFLQPNLPASASMSNNVQSVLEDSTPFIIYDAGFEANKNTDALAKIFAGMERRMPRLNLVVTGTDFEPSTGKPANERSQHFMQLADSLGMGKNVIPVGRVSEEELVALFRKALAYMNMSGYEGFGLGPLQAMAVGTPTIISNNPCFVEISGPAALVVDPTDIDQAVDQSVQLLSDASAREDLATKAQKYAQGFTWAQTFRQTWTAIAG